jgi:hypothetical protein
LNIVANIVFVVAVALAVYAVYKRPADVYVLTRIAKVMMLLLLAAGAVAVFYAQRHPTDDAQDALVIPGIIFATLMAIAAVWVVDVIVRALRRHYVKPTR